MTSDSHNDHEFAWDGISFSIPASWNLSGYEYAARSVTVRMEDDYAVRLELEWTRFSPSADLTQIRTRYKTMSEGLSKTAESEDALRDLPAGWTAFLYIMPDRRRLLTAFYLAPGNVLFCFFRIHFDGQDKREPHRILSRIIETFRLHDEAFRPWRFYDVSFRLPGEFRLVSTSFLAGQKALLFERKLRRLHLWFFSLADKVLKGRHAQEWAADFLNHYKKLRGPVFVAGEDGSISAKRSRAYPLGQFEEIGRWCFRYQVICRQNPETNMIGLAVFHYRQPSDLSWISVPDLFEAGASGAEAEPSR